MDLECSSMREIAYNGDLKVLRSAQDDKVTEKRTMSTKIFQSNETLEMCDVKVSQDGRIEIATKSYHTEELQRLGTLVCPEATAWVRALRIAQGMKSDPTALINKWVTRKQILRDAERGVYVKQ